MNKYDGVRLSMLYAVLFGLLILIGIFCRMTPSGEGVKIVTEYCHKDYCHALNSTYVYEFPTPIDGIVKITLNQESVVIMGKNSEGYYAISKQMNNVKWPEGKNGKGGGR